MSTVVRVRRHPWDADSVVEVLLANDHSPDQWTVEYDGQVIGTVGRYTGSIDRSTHHGLLRVPGKRRTLWSARPNHPEARTVNKRLSRADAIRWLLP